jgi:hypothetical protein
VASLCSKCGAELSPDAQTCPACGTPVVAVAVPVVQPVAVVPAKQGSSALKIILIIIAVFVGLGLIAAGAFGYFVWRVAHAVHVAESTGKVSIPSIGGISASTNETFTSADLGTDIYPGATAGKGSLRMSLPSGSMVTAIYVTSDTKDQVLAYYKGKLGDASTVMDTSDGAIVTLKKGENESVMVTITANSSQYDGKTQIAIVHTTSTKSN